MSNKRPIVIIIDDDAPVRTSLTALMECVGLEVVAFENAEDFFSESKNQSPDFMIVDIRLPGMSGIELLERLRAEGNQVPAAVVSGNADIAKMAQDTTLTNVHFLSKPSDPSMLICIVTGAVGFPNPFPLQ